MELITRELVLGKLCQTLCFRNTNIASQGAEILSQALRHNNTLKLLSISQNQLDTDGVKALVEAPSEGNNTTLKELCLNFNKIHDDHGGTKSNSDSSRLTINGNERSSLSTADGRLLCEGRNFVVSSSHIESIR